MKNRQTQTSAVPVLQALPKKHRKLAFTPDLIALLLLIATATVYYWPVISIQGSFWNDFIEQYFPYRAFATQALSHLTFPFWNPYSFSGIPFFADIQSGVLYPLNLLLIPFGSGNGLNPVAFEYQIVMHIMLAGICMYVLARDFSLSRTASLFAGIIYMLGGFGTAHIFHVTMIHTLPWFAMALFTLRRALERSSLPYTIATAGVLCCTAFAGHPQMYVYIHYLLGGYLAYHLIERFRSGSSLKKIAVPSALFLLAVTLGAGMSSVQLLPTAQLGKESIRPEMEFEKSAQGSLRPYRFITLLAPNFFSAPKNNQPKNPAYWGLTKKDVDPGSHYYWETAMYLGVLPLFLALIALCLGRSPPVLFLGVTAVIALLFAMGDATPFYKAAYTFIPGVKMFRNPARIGILYTLAMSLLAAFGTDWLFRQAPSLASKKKRGLLIAIGGGAAAALIAAILFSGGAFTTSITDFVMNSGALGSNSPQIGAYVASTIYPHATLQMWIFALIALLAAGTVAAKLLGALPPRIFSIAIAVVLVADLLLFGYGFAVTKTNPRTIYSKTKLITSIQDDYRNGLYRINSRGSIPGSDDIGGPYMIFRRNEGTVHSICLMEGYNPLRLKRQLMDRKDRTLDILNIRYKINVDEQRGAVDIVNHPTCLPRARMVSSYRVAATEAEIVPLLRDSAFDHVNEIVIEETPDFVPSGRHEAGNSTARIVSWSSNRIVTEVNGDRPAFLVLSEIHYPAWKATIDGKAAKVLRADYALRAIAVPAGNHTVVCKYDDDAFNKGLIISLISLAAALGILTVVVVRRRRQQAGSNTDQTVHHA